MPPGLECVPLDFEFQGSFFDLADFFHRLKRFVNVANDKVSVGGRLMTVDSLKFTTEEDSFPKLKAEVTATVYLSPKQEGATAGASPQGPSGSPLDARRGRRQRWRLVALDLARIHPDRHRHAMKHFFQDLWQDLREKRMWPFAALLVVALVALPVVLSEKRKAPPPAPAAANAQPEQLPNIEITDDTVAFSNLQSFKAKDPFKPGQKTSQDLTENSATVIGNQPGSGGGSSSPGGADPGRLRRLVRRERRRYAGRLRRLVWRRRWRGRRQRPGPLRRHPARVLHLRDRPDASGAAAPRAATAASSGSRCCPTPTTPCWSSSAPRAAAATRSSWSTPACARRARAPAPTMPAASSPSALAAEHRFRTESGREYVLVIDRIRRVKAGASSSSARSNASARTAKGRTRVPRRAPPRTGERPAGGHRDGHDRGRLKA